MKKIVFSFLIIFTNCQTTPTHQSIPNNQPLRIFKIDDPIKQMYFKEFIEPNIQNISDSIPKSIIAGQAILESNCGDSEVARELNNHFGIKSGKKYKLFKSDADCFQYHQKLLLKRYYVKGNYVRWAINLENRGYAQSDLYAETLIQVIKQNKLYELDAI